VSVTTVENLTTNIASHLGRMAEIAPQRPAVVCPQRRDRRGRRSYVHLTFRQLDERSDRVARGLVELGIGPESRTALLVPPSLDFYTLVFALFKAGAVMVCIDPGIGVRRMGRCLDEAAPNVFLGSGKAHWARRILGWARRHSMRSIVVGGQAALGRGVMKLEEVERLGEGSDAPLVRETPAGRPAAILFTSGSTGPPKGAFYTQGNFNAQVDALREACRIEPGEIDLGTFPLFGLFAPALGMTSIVPVMDFTRPGQVDPREIIEPIESFGVTSLFGSPALLRRVGNWAAARGVHLPTLRRVVTAGAPVPAEVLERFASLLPPNAIIYTPYGATESLPVATIDHRTILSETAAETARGRGVCVGHPVSTIEARVIRISDEPISQWSDDLLVEQGEIGEIVVRGPMVTREYFANAAGTALAKIDDGQGGVYHRMGDVGYQDEQGRLWFCGRKSQRVECEHGRLLTIPCEGVFNQHPQVLRTALVGVERKGRIEPVLCVETLRDVSKSSHGQIIQELRALSSTTDVTRSIETFLFHRGFPVDIRHNAKIDRQRLAEWAKEQLR